MNYYILGIFLNYLFFVIGGIFYHILMVDGYIDNRMWLLFPIGGLLYFPVYLITNISIINYVKGRRKYVNLYVLPVLLTIFFFLILIELDVMDGFIWIVLLTAQMLTSLSIHLIKYLSSKWSK